MTTMKACVYCGDVATTRDHVMPRNVSAMNRGLGLQASDNTVPACLECNMLAGDDLFVDFAHKKRAVLDRLRARHKGLLAMPDWSEAELSQCGEEMRRAIVARLAMRDRVRKRLSGARVVIAVAPPKPKRQRPTIERPAPEPMECPYCRREFTPKTRAQRYCRPSHGSRHAQIEPAGRTGRN